MDVINISTEINYAIDYDRSWDAADTATTFARGVGIATGMHHGHNQNRE